MVRKAGLGILFLLISILILGGCDGQEDVSSEDGNVKKNGLSEEEKKDEQLEAMESNEMDKWNVAEKIQEQLKCDIRTAESIVKQCSSAGVEGVSDVEVQPDEVYTLLRMSGDDGIDYYAFLGDGFFLEQIRKGSEDGEQIYMVME